MGERANFGFRQENGDTIFLYGHWAGGSHLETLAIALHTARPRWSDEPYATRICISQIISTEWSYETGWGIATYLMHNEYSVPIVDWSKGVVYIHDYHAVAGMIAEPSMSFTLDDYVNDYFTNQLRRVPEEVKHGR